MRWVKRCLWLAAWGVWVWLGVGLYRELPRDVGPVVGSITLDEEEGPLGVFKDGTLLATYLDGRERASEVRVWDLQACSLRSKFEIHTDASRLLFLAHLGLIAAPAGANPDSRKRGFGGPSALLDLETGAWTELPETCLGVTFHPRKPWCLSSEGPAGESAVRLYDLSVGKFLLQRRSEAGVHARDAYFVGDDYVAIPVDWPAAKPGEIEQGVEVWMAPEGIHLWTLAGVPLKSPSSTSRDARAAWDVFWLDGWTPRYAVQVYDFGEHRMAFDSAPAGTAVVSDAGGDTGGDAVLSADGRSVLDTARHYGSARLLAIDSGRLLWAESDVERLSKAGSGYGFEIEEKWSVSLGSWRWERKTYALRRHSDGHLIVRCWEPSGSPLLETAPPRGFRINPNTGEVREITPRVNYPLLALCQTILAPPLVMLWAVVRWSRKRRERRLAGATA